MLGNLCNFRKELARYDDYDVSGMIKSGFFLLKINKALIKMPFSQAGYSMTAWTRLRLITKRKGVVELFKD